MANKQRNGVFGELAKGLVVAGVTFAGVKLWEKYEEPIKDMIKEKLDGWEGVLSSSDGKKTRMKKSQTGKKGNETE